MIMDIAAIVKMKSIILMMGERACILLLARKSIILFLTALKDRALVRLGWGTLTAY